MQTFTATYSPEDNKIRLSASSRLDPDLYARVRGAGYIWAPKQGIFVAPMWTPAREDLALELAGEIGDEDTSLFDRAEERAERFETYSENRASDANSARNAVSAIANNIPFGQPILVGHHSEKHARKDAERIENGMRKAVKMWETSQYWQYRAAGAIRAAKYKERPDVRARRIKGLESDLRKAEKNKADCEKALKVWTSPALTLEQAINFAGFYSFLMPRKEGDRPDFEQRPSAYDALSGSYPNLYAPRSFDEVKARAVEMYPRHIAHHDRWISHYSNRIAYEKAMLNESGGLVTDRVVPEVGGAVMCLWGPRGGWAYIKKVNKVTVTISHQWNPGGRVFAHKEPLDKIRDVMSKAQVDEARAAGRIQEAPENIGFWLMQSREDFDKAEAKREQTKPEAKAEAADFAAMKETLKAGVQVVSVPQLFPTPPELAARMVELAQIEAGQCVLEPSAGTGNLVKAVLDSVDTEVLAYEISPELCAQLNKKFPSYKLVTQCGDFLEARDFMGQYPRIVMNPPFANGQDIAHIQHATGFLAPGGRLVAICANGPRQNEKLRPMACEWYDLPPNSFAGTGVNAAMLVIQN